MEYLHIYVNTNQSAGVSTSTILQNLAKKKVKILEFGDDIEICHDKCIDTSTNMPCIGSEIPEIAFKIS